MREPKDIKIGEFTLKEILERHRHWWLEDCDGWRNMRANLYGADLCGADLCGADLSRADLSGAGLSRANLYGADLCGADLSRAGLSGAGLSRANLCGADLSRADLSRANLSGANLSGANLSRANLYGANLSGANLYGANLSRAENVPFVPMACPDTGSFIGFKKASGHIVMLGIPEDARRLSATGRKCRCDKAIVIRIQEMDGTTSDLTEVTSDRDSSFVYKVGKMVSVPDFCEDRWQECSAGIHFFINRQEAVNY